MQDVTRFYGLHTNRSGMACCPFHEDKTPSLKIYDNNYYCFGCGVTGDCTDFTARLFDISQLEAARKISYDFGLNLFEREIAVSVNNKLTVENELQKQLRNTQLMVSEYLKKLYEWRTKYKPVSPSEVLHPLFVECLQKTSHIEYLSEVLTRTLSSFGTDTEKRNILEDNKNSILMIQQRLKKLAVNENVVKRKVI